MHKKQSSMYFLASTECERNLIIVLRTRIYKQAFKHQRPELMTDKFDKDAYLIGVLNKREELVASARVICNDSETEWEHDRFVDWGCLTLPAKNDCCEVSRFCISLRYRNWEVIRHLCHGISEAMLRSKRKYIIACCTDELVPFYKNFFGATFVGKTFIHSDLGQKPHHLFKVNYLDKLHGRGIKLRYWMILWPSAVKHAMSNYPEIFYGLSSSRVLALKLSFIIEQITLKLISLRKKKEK